MVGYPRSNQITKGRNLASELDGQGTTCLFSHPCRNRKDGPPVTRLGTAAEEPGDDYISESPPHSHARLSASRRFGERRAFSY
jgi:hypothetical protein